MNNEDELALVFLGRLSTQLERCKRTHAHYLRDGQKYLYAQILMEANREIRELILSQAYLLPEQHHVEALDLLEHIDIWMKLWIELDSRRHFGLQEAFVFDNDSNFPRESAESLMSYLSKLRGCTE